MHIYWDSDAKCICWKNKYHHESAPDVSWYGASAFTSNEGIGTRRLGNRLPITGLMHCGDMASVDLGDSMLTDVDARGVGALEDLYCCACGAAVRMTAPHECICRCIFGCVGALIFGFRLGTITENLPD